MKDRQTTGTEGEDAGAEFLRGKGYKIIERNYRAPFGEIDIIARDGKYLVFVEVKRRRTGSFGGPQEAVDRRKQKHIIRTALVYIKEKRYVGFETRFDVLCLGPGEGEIDLIVSAFNAPGYTV